MFLDNQSRKKLGGYLKRLFSRKHSWLSEDKPLSPKAEELKQAMTRATPRYVDRTFCPNSGVHYDEVHNFDRD